MRTTQSRTREIKTKRILEPSCKNYLTCQRVERYQEGRCNERCCSAYKKKKK